MKLYIPGLYMYSIRDHDVIFMHIEYKPDYDAIAPYEFLESVEMPECEFNAAHETVTLHRLGLIILTGMI